jgi:hypothetical protein
LAITFIAYGLLLLDQTHRQELRQVSTLNGVKIAITDIELNFRNIISDLRYLAESKIVVRYADGDDTTLMVPSGSTVKKYLPLH